jgi:hypothetical protein
MTRRLWAAPLVIALGGAFVLTQGSMVSKAGAAGGPFVLGSYVYPSKQAFIESGHRCATPTPDEATVLAVEQALGSAPAATGGPQGGPKGGVSVVPGRGRGMSRIAANAKIIPVHFHVIMNSSGQGNVTDQQIQTQMDRLNEGFCGLEQKDPAFNKSAQITADTGFRFVLASVQRITNDTWFNWSFNDFDAKSQTRIGGAGALNVWTAELSGGVLGYAQFPFSYTLSPETDGIVLHYDTMPGGAFQGFNLGDTGIHEVGHWVGLFHTFQGSCFTPGDGVKDTPAEAFPFFGTPPPYPDTCTIQAKPLTYTANPGRDPVENYMDYSDDIVMFQFTKGQVSRLQKMMQLYRGF